MKKNLLTSGSRYYVKSFLDYEKKEPSDITEIHNRHEEWLGNSKNCLTVDASQGFRDDKNIMKNLVNQIIGYVNKSVNQYDHRFMQNDWLQWSRRG